MVFLIVIIIFSLACAAYYYGLKYYPDKLRPYTESTRYYIPPVLAVHILPPRIYGNIENIVY